MIEHTPGASPNLSTQILLALDELQEMANRAYWIAGLVPPGTKPPAVIVLSKGQVVIRSAEKPFTEGEVLLGSIKDGGLTMPGSMFVSSGTMNTAPAVEKLRRYWGRFFSGEMEHEATILLLQGRLPMSDELRSWGVTAAAILDETLMDIELNSMSLAPTNHELSLIKDALLEYCGEDASSLADLSSHDVERIRELIDWVRSHTELGPEIEEIRRKLAP